MNNKTKTVLLYSKRRIISLKNFGTEVHALKDVDKFLNESKIIVNEKSTDVDEILENLFKIMLTNTNEEQRKKLVSSMFTVQAKMNESDLDGWMGNTTDIQGGIFKNGIWGT